jgi:hydroxymethylpyrimidine pyrophosphatase-like HAD family hydrolase
MPSQIRAVALDYDGTLAMEGGPTPAVLDAIAETRARGLRVVLVTGRILSELRAVFRCARRASTRWWRRTAR